MVWSLCENLCDLWLSNCEQAAELRLCNMFSIEKHGGNEKIVHSIHNRSATPKQTTREQTPQKQHKTRRKPDHHHQVTERRPRNTTTTTTKKFRCTSVAYKLFNILCCVQQRHLQDTRSYNSGEGQAPTTTVTNLLRHSTLFSEFCCLEQSHKFLGLGDVTSI